ncbi:cysteine desulfurase [Clostridium sp. SYSU_GA19001]|uniref:cysteine desulfurase family protein n=1 Tax=Clostridium caldaquaticum TaxID=2940653 RepID=UPI0020774470|nr:cysteine desulfurase family protein [Clostridium caldaquaticum]MCM8711836.1 cysteine desulfurase [Clostridium caldaquaticum]
MEIYLDNSATTKPYDEVIDIVADTMKNYYANPSSAYSLGIKAEGRMNESREVLAKTLNCSKDEIIFTSGGSESNNFLIRGFVKEGSHIITTKIEHPSVINICKELESLGAIVTYLNVDSRGKIDINELESSINKDTVIVSIMHVNNEIGVVQDIETIGRLLKEKSSRIKFHVDAVQSYGKFKIDVQKTKIDLLSVSSHKIHGPRGVGLAYVRKGLVPKPLIFGGGQEKSFRSGTENLAAIAGFAKAAQIIYENREENFQKIIEVKNYFITKLAQMQGVKINSPMDEDFSPYILSISFKGVRAEVLLHLLEEGGVYVSTGSACSSKDTKDSHVLKAIGLKDDEIKGTIRFSFSEYSTKEEVDYTVDLLNRSLRFLRRVRI